jgi:hypothetical protein|tara:strand:- start:1310 stop:1591 length:282 start_codon:yes stop_codon:yes gene_type:complete
MTKNTEIKFTKDELDSLQQLRTNYANIELSLGKLEIARIQQEQKLENLSNEKLRLETQYSEAQGQEVTLVQELNDKYGAGNLDPETGVFTPVK